MNNKIKGMIPALVGGMIQRLASVTAKSTSLLGLILNATLNKEGKILLASLNNSKVKGREEGCTRSYEQCRSQESLGPDARLLR